MIGSLTAVYTATEYANGSGGGCPRVGSVFFDPNACKKYIFLKNEGSTDIAAGQAAKVNDASAFACELSDTKGNPSYAGHRVVGASALSEDEYGWFQISGNITVQCDGTATAIVDQAGVQLSGTNGHVEGAGASTAADVNGTIGLAQAASTADETVEVQITKNAWGV